MQSPSRSEIANTVRRLLTAQMTRKAASEWASQWLFDDEPISDCLAWEALVLLGAAELVSTDRPFLYNEEDYLAALESLEKADASATG